MFSSCSLYFALAKGTSFKRKNLDIKIDGLNCKFQAIGSVASGTVYLIASVMELK